MVHMLMPVSLVMVTLCTVLVIYSQHGSTASISVMELDEGSCCINTMTMTVNS